MDCYVNVNRRKENILIEYFLNIVKGELYKIKLSRFSQCMQSKKNIFIPLQINNLPITNTIRKENS
jgi:hypothetical protein